MSFVTFFKHYENFVAMKKYVPGCDYEWKASISFHERGLIVINAPACRLLWLNEGDKIAFYQNDEGRPKDWFVCKCDDGIKLSRLKCNALSANWKYLCVQIRKSIGCYGRHVSIPVSAERDDNGLHALITSAVAHTLDNK